MRRFESCRPSQTFQTIFFRPDRRAACGMAVAALRNVVRPRGLRRACGRHGGIGAASAGDPARELCGAGALRAEPCGVRAAGGAGGALAVGRWCGRAPQGPSALRESKIRMMAPVAAGWCTVRHGGTGGSRGCGAVLAAWVGRAAGRRWRRPFPRGGRLRGSGPSCGEGARPLPARMPECPDARMPGCPDTGKPGAVCSGRPARPVRLAGPLRVFGKPLCFQPYCAPERTGRIVPS